MLSLWHHFYRGQWITIYWATFSTQCQYYQ